MACAKYGCLKCKYEEVKRGNREEYVEVLVCPKCHGALVDQYRTAKYIGGIDYVAGKNINALLIIELDNETAVPKVFYKGEQVKHLRDVDFEWNTETDVVMGKLNIDIENVDTSGDKPVIKRTGVSKC
ncbi:hypothetical protein SAMN05216232_1978 [Virgibacillus subterraneus]|uniref:Uncharacterized protein n=1 Tax=Virgibacillus subterraneus TaxID=621109 RepID=A0A1H9EC50_9BACI|nr:hypothetical protein [Virgibacillus subterraneus]SEQ23281.1 hypothetical protein SAMN05216232_1978 [Virgibacillus subterraneus]